MSKNKPNFVFFGTPDIAVTVLEVLKEEGFVPTHIVTAPDRPAGRGMKMTPPPVKAWATKNNIRVLQPENLDDSFIDVLRETRADVFVVTAYGKILPKNLLDLPTHGSLNVHPSLLPKYRGASPIESQILADDRQTGVTIMLMDEQMDHGPLLAQTQVELEDWPPKIGDLYEALGYEGGKLLAYVLPRFVAGEIEAIPQNHKEATFCKKIKKEDGHIELDDDPYTNYLKFRAYERWPRTYFFTKDGKRAVISDGKYENGELVIKKVIPEGKKETPYKKI